MRLKLETLSIESDGCFSQLLTEAGDRILYSVERTFENLRVVIPSGVFTCVKTDYYKGGYRTFEITGIEGHSRVLFHKGNTEDDSLACVVVGALMGVLNGKKCVTQSRSAFSRFMDATKGVDEFELEVTGRDLVMLDPVVVTP